jgi:hypothetical protein
LNFERKMGQTLVEIVRTIEAIPEGYVDKDAGIRTAFEDRRGNPIVESVLAGMTTFQSEYERRIYSALNTWKISTPFFS